MKRLRFLGAIAFAWFACSVSAQSLSVSSNPEKATGTVAEDCDLAIEGSQTIYQGRNYTYRIPCLHEQAQVTWKVSSDLDILSQGHDFIEVSLTNSETDSATWVEATSTLWNYTAIKRFEIVNTTMAYISLDYVPEDPTWGRPQTNMSGQKELRIVNPGGSGSSSGYNKLFRLTVYNQKHEIIQTEYNPDYEISWYCFEENNSFPNFSNNVTITTVGRENPQDAAVLDAEEYNKNNPYSYGGIPNDGRCIANVKFPESFKGVLIGMVKQVGGRTFKFTLPVEKDLYQIKASGSFLTVKKNSKIPVTLQLNLSNETGFGVSIKPTTNFMNTINVNISSYPEGIYYATLYENGKYVYSQAFYIRH